MSPMRWRGTIAGVLLGAAGCRRFDAVRANSRSNVGSAGLAAAAHDARFYCPMHPAYRSNRPGDCPVCNMALVAMDGGAAAEASAKHASVLIPPERAQLIGVRTAAVERRPFTKTLRVPGRIEIDERRIASVTPRFSGYVEHLDVKSLGETVAAGAALCSVYSPELLEAQRSYNYARHTLDPANTLVTSARERLLRLEVTAEEIKAFEGDAPLDGRMVLRARMGGTVLKRDVTEGGSFAFGHPIFELADLSSVWLVLDVFQADIPVAAVGRAVRFDVVGAPGATRQGSISFVYPTLDAATRTGRARVDVENRDGALRPGMFAEVALAADLGAQLVVERDAVLDDGTRCWVFVSPRDGMFEPREITLGERGEREVVVASGLAEGERIVTRGNFLIDSESRLEAALRARTPDARDRP